MDVIAPTSIAGNRYESSQWGVQPRIARAEKCTSGYAHVAPSAEDNQETNSNSRLCSTMWISGRI